MRCVHTRRQASLQQLGLNRLLRDHEYVPLPRSFALPPISLHLNQTAELLHVVIASPAPVPTRRILRRPAEHDLLEGSLRDLDYALMWGGQLDFGFDLDLREVGTDQL